MMSKLNQVIAVEKGVKTDTTNKLTKIYHSLQKLPPLQGISRSYRPKDEDGDRLPSESTLVQVRVEEVFRDISDTLTRLFDLTAVKDYTNTTAFADVMVEGETLLEHVPVTYLMFLEKQLTDLKTVLSHVPTLDPAENWHLDSNVGVYSTDPVETTRTKKVPRNHVKSPATDKHPAQVEMYYEDVVVGYWQTVKFSGAVPKQRVNQLLERVSKLQQAVKFAREQANGVEVTDVSVGRAVFDYLFAA